MTNHANTTHLDDEDVGRSVLDSTLRRVSLSTGVELDVCVLGDPSNPPIIFLHGFPESHRTWRHQLLGLSDEYYCIAPDQRGYRGSSKPIEVGEYAIERLTADVFALADAFGLDEFSVAGHDWGGAVAWSVALTGQPDGFRKNFAGRVHRAMLANAPHPCLYQRALIDDPAQRAAAQYVRVFRDPASDALIREGGLLALLEKVWNWQKPEKMEVEIYEDLLAGWGDRDAAYSMIKWYRASEMLVPALGEVAQLPDWAAGEFPHLKIPTLLIWAMEDRALPPSNIKRIESLVPNIEIERVGGCGHFVTWERPEVVTAAMRRFLLQTS